MTINISIFGQLTDIITKDDCVINDIADTNALIELLNKKYPALANIKYAIAVNKNIITNNTKLNDNDSVALMPPFSGG